jgi:SAM-dependent methyltransferase
VTAAGTGPEIDPTERAHHWDRVWAQKDPTEVSWFQPRLETPLRLIWEAGLPPGARVLDVGGGVSTLVDSLLELGYRPGVLDISARAIQRVRGRLGKQADEVEWFVGDVTSFISPHPWDLWHDRAVLHFLIEEPDRGAYRSTLLRALSDEGCAVISTFGPAGPTHCSGLPVRRYSARDLADFLGPELSLEASIVGDHVTPSGRVQQFVGCRLRRGQSHPSA